MGNESTVDMKDCVANTGAGGGGLCAPHQPENLHCYIELVVVD